VKRIKADVIPGEEQDRLFALLDDPETDPDERAAARDRLIVGNVALMVRALGDTKLPAIPWDDCFGWGLVALTQCVDGFRPELGWKFSTYFGSAFYHRFRRLIADNEYLIRLPRYLACPPPKTSPEALRDAEAVRRVVRTGDHGRLDRAVYADDGEDLRRLDRAEHAESILAALDPDDAELLRRRYGIGREPETMASIARDRGTSHKQIETWTRAAIRNAKKAAVA